MAIPAIAFTLLAGGAIAGYATMVSADTSTDQRVEKGEMIKNHAGMFGKHGRGHGVMGNVTAVNGSTITVSGRNGETYTVNADAATVQKMTTGSLSDVQVGDTIGVQGDVSGTTVTAKTIMADLPHPAEKPTATQ